MKQNIEIEYKTMLDESLYNSLREALPFDQGALQINTYYDTLNRDLFSHSIMCRIREYDNTFELTIKIPQEKGVLELEKILEDKDLNDPDIEKFLREYDIDPNDMREVALSKTKRHLMEDQYGVWCLDKTEFKHHTDYELEYELFEDHPLAYDHYKDKLQSNNIEYHESKPKYIRALNSKI